jgi:hypothetical protein
MDKRRILPCILSVMVLANMTGCATTRKTPSSEDNPALAWMKGLFPEGQSPESAQNVQTYEEHFPLGSLLLGKFEAQTEDLDRALDRSHWLPMRRQFFENGEAKEVLTKRRELKDCPWWTPDEACVFGSTRHVKYWLDRLEGETKRRQFYDITYFYAGIKDLGNGRSVFYLYMRADEPEQESG